MSSGNQNLKIDERLSYITTLTCQFGRCRYKRLSFWAAHTVICFQWKIDKNYRNLPNVFGIADVIFVVGYDSDDEDHDETLASTTNI